MPRVDGAGIYAFFLTDPALLHGIHIETSGPLYLGKTESSLDARNHFTHKHSGFSTLRRSLGAILKQHEMLKSNSSREWPLVHQYTQLPFLT